MKDVRSAFVEDHSLIVARDHLLSFQEGKDLSSAIHASVAQAQSARRPYLDAARVTFFRLSAEDRLGLSLLLMATGDYNAMVSDGFNGRLYDSVFAFQQRHGLETTGIPDPAMMAQLGAKGGPILRAGGTELDAAGCLLGV